jgi:hypothetical protein
MKNLSDLLRRSNITPLERVTAIVHNDIYREKNGKDALSYSDIYVLTQAWSPHTFEAQEYNKYIKIIKLESFMKMDAQMFLCRSELSLLRNQRMLDNFRSNLVRFKGMAMKEFAKDIPAEDCIKLLTQSTYFEYQRLLHIFTFNKLSKETQEDLYLLNDTVASDNQYLEDQVFLYERFKDGNELSNQEKDLIISRIYSCMYYEGAKRIKKSTAEKDGFLLHHFFAELPIKEVFKKLAKDVHISHDNTEESLLSTTEEYAKSKNVSIESLIKDTLFRWLDNGLFVNEHSLLYTSDNFDTWNGDTKKNHKELFTVWYTELKKSEQYFQKLFDAGKLVKQNLEKDFLGMPRTVEIVTGSSLYISKEDVDFVKEYKEQIKILLPLANMFLFAKKHTTPVKNYKTLCEFKNLTQKPSSIFDIDMAERYDEFIELYKEEVVMINNSFSRLVDTVTEHLYTEKSLLYIVDIVEDNFNFDLDTGDDVAEIVELYSAEFKKLW